LVFESTPRRNTDYEYALTIPGKVIVPELGACIEARVTEIESVPEQERHTLLNPDHLGAKILIRNWRPGDRYCPAHTAAERKVKELLAARHATGMEKKLWPVAVAEDSALVWMRGFAAPKALGARAGKAIWIREIAAKNPAEYPTEDSKTPADDGR
jgi:putative SOS response-associated peptidase YedK